MTDLGVAKGDTIQKTSVVDQLFQKKSPCTGGSNKVFSRKSVDGKRVTEKGVVQVLTSDDWYYETVPID